MPASAGCQNIQRPIDCGNHSRSALTALPVSHASTSRASDAADSYRPLGFSLMARAQMRLSGLGIPGKTVFAGTGGPVRIFSTTSRVEPPE